VAEIAQQIDDFLANECAAAQSAVPRMGMLC
jgi:hypothetical protein